MKSNALCSRWNTNANSFCSRTNNFSQEYQTFLKDLDFSGLPPVAEEVAREPGPVSDFFKVDQNLFNFEEIANKIDMEEVAKIDIEKINIPETISLFSDILKDPIVDLEQMQPQKTLPSVLAPIMPCIPGEPEPFFEPTAAPVTPVQKLPQSIFANIPQPIPQDQLNYHSYLIFQIYLIFQTSQ